MDKTAIVGAGLAGLITACAIPEIPIYEAGPYKEAHKAVLRFRDQSVARLTGIQFRSVTVRKSIYVDGEHVDACNIRLANLYARKVTGALAADRSIWNLDTVTRYIAPEDFYNQLVHKHKKRIHWENQIHLIRENAAHATISTIPLPTMMKVCGMEKRLLLESAPMQAAPIEVLRYRLPQGSDVFQTVYFPSPHLRTYRASITGDLLIVERIKTAVKRGPEFSEIQGLMVTESHETAQILHAFGLSLNDVIEIERVDQKYGKILDISREDREAILFELTHRFNVFSIGRFATWRNILLDDVVKDIDVVKRLMTSSSYGRRLMVASKE